MKNTVISRLLKLSIALVALVGICICAFWYPFSVSLTAVGLPSGERVPITSAESVSFWTQLFFYWIASVPCFIVLGIGWRISSSLKNDNVFTAKNANLLMASFKLLFVDSCVFLIGNAVFTVLKWNVFAVAYFILGVFGLISAFAFYVVSRYISNAMQLKEENESFI